MMTQTGNQGLLHSLLAVSLLSTLVFGVDSDGDSPKGNPLKYSRYPAQFSPARPLLPDQKLLVEFNQKVLPAEAGRNFYFFESGANLRIAAKASRPSAEELAAFSKRFANSDPLFFAWLQPATPLSPGAWQLRTAPGMKSLDGSHAMTTALVDPLAVIEEFKITAVSTINPYDGAKAIEIGMNKYALRQDFTDERLASFIEVVPQPGQMKIESGPHQVRVSGDFGFRSYEVKIKPGLVALDGLTLKEADQRSVEFHPNEGFLQLPLSSATQNASGHRSFSVRTANLKSVRSRVKSLTGDQLLFALKGYEEGYAGDGGQRTIPFSLVAGKTIFDQTRDSKAALDHSESFDLSWDEINPASRTGAYYVCCEGASLGREGATMGAQSLVQLTDIGLAWKQGVSETLVYAFSLKSGQPLPGLRARLLDDEGTEVASQETGADGTVRFPLALYDQKQLWLDASTGGDRHLMPFSAKLSSVGLWSFDIPYRWDAFKQGERRALLFTDRDVYKPGDTVYLKGISRTTHPDGLDLPAAAQAQLRVSDQRGRTILDKKVTLSERGSFDEQFTLSENAIGYHSIRLDFNDPGSDAEGEEDWSRIFHHSFQVAEYRVNTFEISMESKDRVAGEKISIPLKAKYYMGKPLSKAKVDWNAYSYVSYPGANTFAGFSYGDYQRDDDHFSENDELELTSKGDGEITFEIPDEKVKAAPREVIVRAEVTDINQQTISQRTSFRVHSSDFYLGVKKPEGVYRAGDETPFLLGNVDTEGKAYTAPVKAELTVEKEIWTSVKVMGSDGKMTHRNELTYELVSRESFEFATAVEPKTGMPASQTRKVKFAEGGDYVLTFASTDNSGRRVATRIPFRVIGAEDPAWAWHDVVAIDVIPDKKQYQAGETARLLVRSPVFGQALLTTERSGIREVRPISIENFETVIDLPIQPGDAPNIFASVLLVRGAAQSPHKHPATDYRLGYCQLAVNDPATAPQVEITTSGEAASYLPGQEVEATVRVADAHGKAVAGAEVTLYAVDEGVLSLTGYATPNPAEVFYQPFPLSVMMGQSISTLFPENPLERDFGNKGYVIGGGDDPGGSEPRGDLSRMRKDFKALAFWRPSLITDADGKVSCRFTAPDNLTTFRVIAVAAKDHQFASAQKPLVINKPVMIEPSLPSFTNLGDQIDIAAVLHNNTDKPQDIKISVTLDDHAVFVEKIGDVVPTSLAPEPLRRRQFTLSVAAGQTQVAHFPVAMIKTGTASWDWKIESENQAGLVDQVRSQLDVKYPNPLFRASGMVTAKNGDRLSNLLEKADPRLLNGRGTLTVSYSNSRIVEAAEALDYLLTYPYGCVEQTTSSTLPWLSTQALRKAIPGLNADEAATRKAIEKGINRLLSMQTSSGGLGYWPGDEEPVLWGSAYAGLAIAKATPFMALPAEQLDSLWNYLFKSLEGSAGEKNPYELSQRCLVLYTLALAGKAQPSYLDVLYKKRDTLPIEGRNLLALAMMESGGKDGAKAYADRVEELINLKPSVPRIKSDVAWYQNPYRAASSLMAWNHHQPGTPRVDKEMDDLLKLLRSERGWGSTYSNAWSLFALADVAQTLSSAGLESEVTVQFRDDKANQHFGAALASHEKVFPIEGDQRGQALSVKMAGSSPVYVKWKLETQPAELSLKPENHGFEVQRSYQKVEPDGTLRPADDLAVGDLVLVRLDLGLPQDDEPYLAIDDSLPANLEAINPHFQSQATREAASAPAPKKGDPRPLYASYREIRQDRVLFFANHIHDNGKYYLEYLARVIAPGQCIAPPCRIEAMYQPERFGLSGTVILKARKLDLKGDGEIVAR